MQTLARDNRQIDFKFAAFASLALAGVGLVLRDVNITAMLAVPILLFLAALAPFHICLIFVVFSFFRLHEAFPVIYDLQIPLWLGAFSFIGLLWNICVKRTVVPAWPSELKWFAALFGWTTFSVIFAFDRTLAWNNWNDVYVKIFIMTLAIGWLAKTPAQIKHTAQIIVGAGGLIAMVAIYNSLMGIEVLEGNRVTIGRALNSPIGDPNDLALTLLVPLGFAIALVGNRTGVVNRLLGLSTVLAVVWGILATQSRGGMIGLVAVFAVFGLRNIKSRLLLVVIGIVLVAGILALSGIGQRTDVGPEAGQAIDESAGDRLLAWQAAISMALARPLTGVGLMNFSETLFLYVSGMVRNRSMVAHSTWMTVLAETGFPGFIAFIGMVYAMFRSIGRSIGRVNGNPSEPFARAMSVGLLASLVGFCLSGTFLTLAFTWQVYILLALTVALHRYTTAIGTTNPLGGRAAA